MPVETTLVPGLEDAVHSLDSGASELILDFSSVQRIDARALRAMEKLAAIAEEKPVEVVLRGVNIDIYRVLKLMHLAQRFTLRS
jgi:anti-anti-sigma regulatory factor